MSGALFYVFRRRAFEQIIHGGEKELSPMVEVFFLQGKYFIEVNVNLHGVALIARLAEEDGTPKLDQQGDVPLPVHFGHIIKNGPQHFIAADGIVKGVDQQGDILLVFYIMFHGILSQLLFMTKLREKGLRLNIGSGFLFHLQAHGGASIEYIAVPDMLNYKRIALKALFKYIQVLNR